MKRILKAFFMTALALIITLPVLSGCDWFAPKEEDEEQEQAQLVVSPSEENRGGALSMSVSEGIEGQAAGLETRQVRAQTTPANLPVDWELVWLSAQHSEGVVTKYLSYELAVPIITDGVKWSNRVNLTLLERFEGTAMLRVSLKSDPSISDYVTVKAELPKASIERTVTVSPTSAVELSLDALRQASPAMFSVDCIYPFNSGDNVPYAGIKAVFGNGEEVDLNCTYYATKTVESWKYNRRYVYQLKLTRTDMTKIIIGGTEDTVGGTAQLSISCTPIGTQVVDVEKNMSITANRVIDFSAGDSMGGYYPAILGRSISFSTQNIPVSNHFTIEVYYECVAPYEGEFDTISHIAYKYTASSSSSLKIEYQSTLPKTGNFAISSFEGTESYSYGNFYIQKMLCLSDYTHETGTRFMNFKIFFYEGDFDPTRIPSEYAV